MLIKFGFVCKTLFRKIFFDNKAMIIIVALAVVLSVICALLGINLISKIAVINSDREYSIYTEFDVEEGLSRLERLDKTMYADYFIISGDIRIGDKSKLLILEGRNIKNNGEILASSNYYGKGIVDSEVLVNGNSYTVVGVHTNSGFFLPFEGADKDWFAEIIVIESKLSVKKSRIATMLTSVFYDCTIDKPNEEGYLTTMFSSAIFLLSLTIIAVIFVALAMCYIYLISETKKEVKVMAHIGYSYAYIALIISFVQLIFSTLCFVLGSVLFFVLEKLFFSVAIIESVSVFYRLSFIQYLTVWAVVIFIITLLVLPYINRLCSIKSEVHYD